ncbi:MAG: 1,4-alpha-glucan branching protein GlgB [Alphaproteobacteria bacterium]
MSTQDARPEVDAIVGASHGDPFSVLGMHADDDGRIVVRTFQPAAVSVAVIEAGSGKVAAELARIHDDGFFEGAMPRRKAPFRYRLRLDLADGPVDIEDPYGFPPVLGDLDVHLLAEGTHLRTYDRLGAHPREIDGISGVAFVVWAPSAKRVSVVGDFNGWDGRSHPMRLRHGCGAWEIFVPGIGRGVAYKYEILGADGTLLPLKADPYAFYAELRPKTASVAHGLPDWQWRDDAWMASRAAVNAREAPISVYEVHLGSWRRVPEDGDRFLSYTELADQLIPYAKDLGFTHIELMPVSEFPFDGSWGYQPIGLFAPTSRFGPPEDFQAFVDRCHGAGIGVLLDWVSGHFPTDPHGLGLFDGSHLYEHSDPRQGFHMDWNTLIYNYGRREVENFLLGNALFWMDRYHIDGLRVDAVASMLYLDYSREPGQWVPNKYGGRENLESIDFLKRMNVEVFGAFPGATTVAEESTAWPGVSRPTYAGGLGFGFKWNMGWMHDTLRYMGNDPIHRRYHHNDLTFGLLYAFTENFMLPLSHDEVVHGKGSLLDRMPGDAWQKFANLRTYYAFMWTHPGKKLLFMGGEFAQRREWNHDTSLDWHLLDRPEHRGIQSLIRDLNRLYRETPALHQLDCDGAGFEWVESQDFENGVLSFLRLGLDGTAPVLMVGNFTPVPRHGYRLGVPRGGRWDELLNTDAVDYGGGGVGNGGGVEAKAVESHGRPYSVELTVPPLATVVLTAREGAR